MNVKLLLTLVGLIDFLAFVGLCFWDGQPFTYLIIITVTAGLGFTGGVFESIVPSKSRNTLQGISKSATNHEFQPFMHFYSTILVKLHFLCGTFYSVQVPF